MQSVPTPQMVPKLIPQDAGTKLLTTDLETKKGSKVFERLTDTKGVVYEVGVKHGKDLKRNVEKWMIMNILGPFLEAPLGGSGTLSVPYPLTSPVSGVI